MTDYEKQALVTKSNDWFDEEVSKDMIHAIMGICGEAGELTDAVKKSLFYGKPLDRENLKEELGDMFWYMALLANDLGLTFGEIQRANLAKLKARYNGKFTTKAANNRNPEAEQLALKLGITD